MIEVDSLTKSYGQTVAVRGISFQVPRGEVLGFLGPNGAGKTTTMRILTGYLPADSGSVKMAGYDVGAQSLEVRRRLGYLPESAPLYEEMGVVDYLDYVAEMRGYQGAERTRRLRRVIELCGLGNVVAKNIGELSKGYRQRVGLAQAILHDPEILILDEPTSGLDPNQIVEIRELIKTLGREKTVILSTHILPEVKATCSRVMIIADGRLVADDTPDGLETRAAGGAAVIATFRGAGPALEAALGGADHALEGPFGPRRFVGTAGPGLLTWRFEVPAGVDRNATAEAVYRLAARHDWGLTELRHDAASLEEVFRRLTGGDHGAGAHHAAAGATPPAASPYAPAAPPSGPAGSGSAAGTGGAR